LADFVLIPVRPSPANLWAVGGSIDISRAAGRPFAFALTQATRGATITTQALGELSERGPVCITVIHVRVGSRGAHLRPDAPGAQARERPRAPASHYVMEIPPK
jgi:hypothetical protein